MSILLYLVRRSAPNKVNGAFRHLQLVSSSFLAISHGSNDAQKTMGIITMALIGYYGRRASTGGETQWMVPTWVIVACAVAMALGTSAGGWRIMKTMGHKIIKLKPINGFAAETAGSIVILVATHLHAPVSTTHVISSSIMGVGASNRFSAVRWGIAGNIFMAWVLTIPISAFVAALCYLVLRLL
jgi:PiT family inorganic phosphate transporter